jgi:hypothetical protein
MTNIRGSKQGKWRIVTMSGDSNCVQVRWDNGMIVVGNSMLPDGPVLSYTEDERAAFLDGAKRRVQRWQ